MADLSMPIRMLALRAGFAEVDSVIYYAAPGADAVHCACGLVVPLYLAVDLDVIPSDETVHIRISRCRCGKTWAAAPVAGIGSEDEAADHRERGSG